MVSSPWRNLRGGLSAAAKRYYGRASTYADLLLFSKRETRYALSEKWDNAT